MKQIAEAIAPILTPNDNLLSLCFELKMKGWNSQEFMYEMRHLYLAEKLKLTDEQIKQLDTYVDAKWSLGDLFFTTIVCTELSEDEYKSHVELNQREEYIRKVLKTNDHSQLKRKAIEKAEPRLKAFFEIGENDGYSVESLLDYLSKRVTKQ